jgi:hypothetical protein
MINQPFAADSIVHIIQIALTPVFLLSGIAALLGVFCTRLGRVADRVHLVTAALETGGDRHALTMQLFYLRKRMRILEIAVSMGATAGAMTCAATLTLFIGTLREAGSGAVLYTLFGLAVICIFCALVAFLTEVLVTTIGLREKAKRAVALADKEAKYEKGEDGGDDTGPNDDKPQATAGSTQSGAQSSENQGFSAP